MFNAVIKIVFVLFSAFLFQTLSAQRGVSVSYEFGQILPHAPGMEDLKKDRVQGFGLRYYFQNKTAMHWRQQYNYPDLGLGYAFTSFGNPDVLGSSHSIHTFAQFPFIKNKAKFNFGFKGLVGLAYFDKIYDETNNPENIAISQHVNINAEAGFYATWRVRPFFVEYSVVLNHHSNGLTRHPNKGINHLRNRVGVGINLEEPPELPAEPVPVIVPEKRNEFWLELTSGKRALQQSQKKYPVFTASLNYSHKIGNINKLGMGLDILNDKSLTDWARERYDYTGEKEINYRVGPNIQGEFLFGNASFIGAYGFYFGDDTYYVSRAYYKAGAKYRLKNFIAQAMVRAVPLFKAEVITFGLGYTFYSF